MKKLRDRKGNAALKLMFILAIVFVVLLGAFVFISASREVVVTLHGSDQIEVAYGHPYSEPGADAFWQSKYLKFIRGKADLEISGNVDTSTIGIYPVTYKGSYRHFSKEVTRAVSVVDKDAPVITLSYIDDHYTLPGHPYEEEGFCAIDNVDGDLTDKVIATELNGVVTYVVKDAAGNEGSATRQIFYDDREAPIITLEGSDTVRVGDKWTGTYTALDNVDGNITEKVVVSGKVDTSKTGTYEIKYSVMDSYKNKTEIYRKVRVIEGGSGQVRGDPVEGSKIVFLTFDDGPGVYTEDLLDLLDKYGVKVTFFVTNQFPAYQPLIKEEARRGHTVGIHTYSHEYSEVYASESAFWDDFDRMNKIIETQTGSKTDIFRFPGGSSNMVSARYSEGIMTRLTDTALFDADLDYYDWNVESGDAGETNDPDEIAANVIEGIQEHDISVVLMHDIHDYSVEAVGKIIEFGQANGYTFMPIYKGCYKCHHGVNN